MYQAFFKKAAAANRSGAMEPETIRLQSVAEVKNGASLKSHTSRVNQKAMGI